MSCREGSGGHATDSGAELRPAPELTRDALVLRDEPAGEVEGPAGNVGVDVDPAGKNDHAARIDCRTAVGSSDDAAISDADVFDDAVDPVGRIVDPSARYPEHRGPARTAVILPRRRQFWIVAGEPGFQANAVVRLCVAGIQAGFAATARMMRLMTSSSDGYGDCRAGRSGSGISSIRYTVPVALTPVTAVVMCTRASRLVCVTFGSSTMVGMRAR